MRHYAFHTSLIRIFLLFFLVCTSTSQVFAARYNLHNLEDAQAKASGYTFNGINNIGTLVGLNAESISQPFIWRVSVDPVTFENSYRLDDIVLLPTDNLCSLEEAALCLGASLSFADISVSAISSERAYGAGGDIIGWFTDDNGDLKSVLWYQEATALSTASEPEYEYKATILPPLEETARYCTAETAGNFLIPECIYAGLDDVTVNNIKKCASDNTNWQTNGVILYNDTDAACASTAVPICDYALTKAEVTAKDTVNQNTISAISYFYEYNPKKLSGACVLREHVEIALLADQCPVNDTWQDNSADIDLVITPITIACDKHSKAFAINNENTIFGTSYDATKNTRHPVAWFRSDTNKNDGTPLYRAVNLGIERVDVTPKIVKDYNDSRKSSEPEKSISLQLNRWQGEALIASSTTGDVAGILKADDTDTVFKPYYWPKVASTSYDKPMELTSPFKDDSGNYIPFFTPAIVPTAPTLTGISSRQITGWYTGDDSIVRSIKWLLVPRKNAQNITVDVLLPSLIPMIDEGNKGQLLDSNTKGEFVGSTKVKELSGLENDYAFFRTSTCGTQDLNQLVTTEISDAQRLTEAYRIASGRPPNPMLAKGLGTTVNDPKRNYVLLPASVYVNLKVDITADPDKLTVGDEYSYYITLTNNATTYATCVSFTLEAAVYTLESDINGLPREELLAGLTFLRIDSQANLSCKFTPIQVTCYLDRLDPNEPVSIIAVTSPRALLADRQMKTTAFISSTELETTENMADNSAFIISSVERQGCFIATAAYGSYLSPEVKGLRIFRDEVLLKTSLGRWLVETYYDVSPRYADYISQDESRRAISRWALSPLVYLVLYPLPMTVGALFFFVLFYAGFRIKQRNR